MVLNSRIGRRRLLVIVCFAAAVLLSGCASTGPRDGPGSSKPPSDAPRDGGSNDNTRSNEDYGSAEEERADRTGPSAVRPSLSEKSGAVKLTFTADRARYKKKQPVSLRLTAVNDSSETIDLQFPSSQPHDFVIRDSRGQMVWRWSDGRAFAQAIVERRLGPGERLSTTATWNQRTDKNDLAEPGRYEIEAEFLAIGHQKQIGPLAIEITE